MARVFITGSSDGLGLMAGQLLLEQGHSVVLHARNEKRATELRTKVGGAEAIVVGDLSSIAQTKSVAEQVNELGAMDAVIHNAAVGYQERKRLETEDGLPQVFAVNTLAPYILTALIRKPKRLVYLSSGLAGWPTVSNSQLRLPHPIRLPRTARSLRAGSSRFSKGGYRRSRKQL